MMIKTLLLALLMGIGGSAQHASAQPVRVLISIEKDRVSQRFTRQIERQLARRGFEAEDYKLTTDADQYALYQALNDPDTQALIWISHGASPRLTRKMKRQLSGQMGMSAQPELVDYRGDNVAPVFKKYSQNIKFVAVIGCNSQQILDYVESDIATDENIDKFIPSKKVIAQFAIRKAVKQLSHVKLNDANSAQPLDPIEAVVSITRSIPSNADDSLVRPLRIMINGELMGVIPALLPGESKTWSIPVTDKNIKQVKLESGQNIMTPANEVLFGDFKIVLPDQTVMKPFAKTDGTPFGLNFRLYLLP